jgi:hypothetical protein
MRLHQLKHYKKEGSFLAESLSLNAKLIFNLGETAQLAIEVVDLLLENKSYLWNNLNRHL